MNIALSDIDLFELLKEKFGAVAAQSVLTTIKERSEQQEAKFVHRFASKEDLKGLATREDLLKGLYSLKEEVMREIAALRQEVSDLKADMLKWMFIFWTGSTLTIAGMLLAFFKFFQP